ncbi:MAG: DUF4339 domain-containing protein [Opitutales bacterium]
MNIWFEENREKAGPVSEDEIPALVTAGRITDDTLIWHKYLDDWTPFSAAKMAILPGGALHKQG